MQHGQVAAQVKERLIRGAGIIFRVSPLVKKIRLLMIPAPCRRQQYNFSNSQLISRLLKHLDKKKVFQYHRLVKDPKIKPIFLYWKEAFVFKLKTDIQSAK